MTEILIGLLVLIVVLLVRITISLDDLVDTLHECAAERENSEEIPSNGMDLLFFKRKHKTAKPTDRSRNWITARETASRG